MAQDLSITTLGKDATLARNTGSAFGTPTWTAVPHVQDLTRTDARAESNVTGKNEDIATFDTSYRVVKVSFKLVYVKGETALAAFVTAFEANTPLDMLVLNGKLTTVGAYGTHADWKIVKMDESQPLDGNVTYDIEMVPAKTANTPVKVTIAS